MTLVCLHSELFCSINLNHNQPEHFLYPLVLFAEYKTRVFEGDSNFKKTNTILTLIGIKCRGGDNSFLNFVTCVAVFSFLCKLVRDIHGTEADRKKNER